MDESNSNPLEEIAAKILADVTAEEQEWHQQDEHPTSFPKQNIEVREHHYDKVNSMLDCIGRHMLVGEPREDAARRELPDDDWELYQAFKKRGIRIPRGEFSWGA
jgi:hypothetical protein